MLDNCGSTLGCSPDCRGPARYSRRDVLTAWSCAASRCGATKVDNVRLRHGESHDARGAWKPRLSGRDALPAAGLSCARRSQRWPHPHQEGENR